MSTLCLTQFRQKVDMSEFWKKHSLVVSWPGSMCGLVDFVGKILKTVCNYYIEYKCASYMDRWDLILPLN